MECGASSALKSNAADLSCTSGPCDVYSAADMTACCHGTSVYTWVSDRGGGRMNDQGPRSPTGRLEGRGSDGRFIRQLPRSNTGAISWKGRSLLASHPRASPPPPATRHPPPPPTAIAATHSHPHRPFGTSRSSRPGPTACTAQAGCAEGASVADTCTMGADVTKLKCTTAAAGYTGPDADGMVSGALTRYSVALLPGTTLPRSL